MNRTCSILLSLAAVGMIVVSAAAVEPMNLEISVDAAEKTGTFSPLLFGHNMEAADPRVNDSDQFHFKTLLYGQGFWNADVSKPFPAVVEQMKRMKLAALRYPGGCYVHNYDWRKAVGPRAERGIWLFGLDEYIRLCRAMDAEPVITMTDYALPAKELPHHLADLVEYLNAPAVPKYPWAMKRAECGNPEPYKVKYFELGNESDHGNHDYQPGRRFSPEEYIRYFLDSAKLIRQIDPSVKLGLVLAPGHEADCDWNRKLLKACGSKADFVVCHFYGPKLDSGYGVPANVKAAMSYGERLQAALSDYNALIREVTGKNLPIAVTEYNLHHYENWRYSFTGGMVIADTLRTFAKPENGVFMANYWLILNDFWGAIRTGYGNSVEKTAVVTFFETWAKYREPVIVDTGVSAPCLESPAIGGYEAATGGQRIPGGPTGEPLPLGPINEKALAGAGITSEITGPDSFRLEFRNRKEPAYMNFAVIKRPADIPEKVPMLLELSFEARFTPAPGCRARAAMGMAMIDSRGWSQTLSGVPVRGAEQAEQWKVFSATLSTRGDAPGVLLDARIEMPDSPVSGTLEFRNIKVRRYRSGNFPAFPGGDAIAMRSEDGRRLTLICFNKNSEQPANARIELRNFPAETGTFEELYQADPASTEYFEPTAGTVTLKDGVFEKKLPPHSLTAFEFIAK